MVDERILEELEFVKQERDVYLNKLMRVKQKISEGCRTASPNRRMRTPKSTNKSKSRSKSATKLNDHAAITNIQITPVTKKARGKVTRESTKARVETLRLKPVITENPKVRQNGTLNLCQDLRIGDHHYPGQYTSFVKNRASDQSMCMEQGTSSALNEKEREIEQRINRIE
jgi:hypothetical protein